MQKGFHSVSQSLIPLRKKSWSVASKPTRVRKSIYSSKADPHTEINLLGFESVYQHIMVN